MVINVIINIGCSVVIMVLTCLSTLDLRHRAKRECTLYRVFGFYIDSMVGLAQSVFNKKTLYVILQAFTEYIY